MNRHARTSPVCPLSNDQITAAALTILSGALLHAKTELSIAMAVLGLVHAQRLSVTAIGTALARVTGHDAKHGVKQVDRLMSNDGFAMEDCLRAYVQAVMGARKSVLVAMDWTEFALDGHSTICLYMVSNHGRATPLVWLTVKTSGLKGRRNRHEDDLLQLFKNCLPKRPKPMTVIVLADRGFGDVALYAELEEQLGFHFVIRFRCNVLVDYGGERKRADEWLSGAGGERLLLRRAKLTGSRREVTSFVAVHDPAMKEPWFLASSLRGSITAITKLYARRFTIEETFRDQKDMRFGWGLYDVQVTQVLRRDRLLFLAAVTQVILTLLGSAGEQLGLDRTLRVNTATKSRTHSLLRQGREYIKGLLGGVADKISVMFDQMFRRLASNTAERAEI